MEQSVIVCGLGKVGWRVLEYLRVAGLPVVAIDRACLPDDARLDGVRLLRGDFREPRLLEEAGVADSRAVLILTSEDLINISTALMVRNLAPRTRIIVRLYNENLMTRLGKAVSDTVALSISRLCAPLLALTAIQGQGLGAFGEAPDRFEILELPIADGSSMAGRTVPDATHSFGALPLAHLREHQPDCFLADINYKDPLRPGDRLIVCGERQALVPAARECGQEALPNLYLAGWLRRWGRVLWRTLSEMDLAVKICTGILIAVVGLSTLVYHGATHITWHESLYRTVSIIATGADMRADRLDPWQQVFISSLRLAGAALIASFTAIFTNYLLRARLSGALEVGRIPDRGHVVVCGLGNIGFAVVEELLHYDQRVVAIEQHRDSRFMAAVRRWGVASIIADATVLEVLRQAHAGTAAAVIAATSNELANLEIALLARDLNPKLRVVVLLQDLNLARTLRDTANIRFAISVPNLAAPAFVASLFGDRVHSVFLMQNKLFAVMELTVQPGDTFLAGRLLRVLACDYKFMVIELWRHAERVTEKPLDVRLAAGDRLKALGDLDRIFRRQAAPLDWCVELVEIEPEARSFLAEFLAAREAISTETASAMLQNLPFSLGNHLSRGEAEDLVATLGTNGARACVRKREPQPLSPVH